MSGRTQLSAVSDKGNRTIRSNSLGRSITVDTSRARSNADAVRLCLGQLGWKDYPNGRNDGRSCDIYWHAVVFDNLREIVLTGKVNKFPGMNEMARKISLTRALATMQRLHGDEYDFYPRSWFIPAQLGDFYDDYYNQLEMNCGRIPWYIVKPDEGSQGCGIYLIQSPEELQNLDQPQIVQEYVNDPFLFQDSLKFDLRIYAVIKTLNPLSIHIAKEGMARFCTVKYKEPSTSNSHETYMHLTNYSLNKHNENFVLGDDAENKEGSKRLLTTVFHQMEAKGVNTKKVWNDIKEIIVKTVLAMVPEMILYYEHQYNGGVGPSCFHIIGFDILLRKNLQPILLEINACPSLSISHTVEEGENANSTHSVIDEAIKVPLVRDTLLLVMDKYENERSPSAMSRQFSLDDSMVGLKSSNQKFTLREIFPAQFGPTCTPLLLLDKAAYLYLQFVPIRRSLQISMSGFRTVARKCNLLDVISLAELDLMYCKIQKMWLGQCTNGIPFHGFVELLFLLAERKFPAAKGLVEAMRALMHYCELQLRYHGVKSSKLRPESTESDENRDGNSRDLYLLPNRTQNRIQKKRNNLFPKI